MSALKNYTNGSTTLSIMTLSIRTLSIKGLFATLSINNTASKTLSIAIIRK